jgi:cysteine-rich repeat protein
VIGCSCSATVACQAGVVCIGGVCQPPSCGDGVVSPGEACDDGNGVTGDGCGACRKVVALASRMHSCALLDDGSVKCWGYNENGQLGLGDTQLRGQAPNQMGSNLPVVNLGTGRRAKVIAVGTYHTCAILDDGAVKCWGANFGALGLGDHQDRGDGPNEMGDDLPVVNLGTGRTAKAIATGDTYTCAILDDDTVKCWGANFNGQLGLGDTQPRGAGPSEMGDDLPVVNLGTARTAKAIAVGTSHTCALLDDDTVKCWGQNTHGQLGLADVQDRGDGLNEMGDHLPVVSLGTARTAKAITLGAYHTCTLLDDDTVKCWGQNTYGQLGLGNTQNRGDAPNEMGNGLPVVSLGTGRTAREVVAAYGHTCARLDDDTVKCWGYNDYGQLGLGDVQERGDGLNEMGDHLPVASLGTGRTAKVLTAGGGGTCVVLDDDTVKCWGYNGVGSLGLGDPEDRGDGPNEMGDALPTLLLP